MSAIAVSSLSSKVLASLPKLNVRQTKLKRWIINRISKIDSKRIRVAKEMEVAAVETRCLMKMHLKRKHRKL
jgi:hypothetical protein